MSGNTQRILAAIVSVDVVGYSRLMGADETGTLAALRTHRSELIDPKIAEHGGRIVKTMGDGLLLEFPSVVNATQCAIEVQEGMADRNKEAPEDARITFRIGVNLGDIIIEGEDILGDGVNVSARLQEIAEPGGIAISRRVHEDVRDRLDVSFHDGGEQSLKNIARPVHVWRWHAGAAHAKQASTPNAQVLERPAIAVLPFDNLSADSEQEYFVDGITEDIITALSHWRWFPVIARNSTFAYKNNPKDVTKIANELGARYVLEGSIRKVGTRVRINAQLIDATTGHHIWAKRYDRDLDDIFALQDEITETIVASIEPELERAEQQRASHKHPDSLDAWEHSIRALWHLNQQSQDSYAETQRLLKKAIALEPNWSGAISLLALCHVFHVMLGWARNTSRPWGDVLSTAKQAVATNDSDWLAHATLGMAYVFTHQYDQGMEELRRAIDLNPSAAKAYHFLGGSLAHTGNPAEGIGLLETALRLDPHDPFHSDTLAALALAHILLRNFEEAVSVAEKAVGARPANVRGHQRLVAALGHTGRVEDARAALEELKLRQPDLSLAYIDATYAFKNSEDRDLFLDGLRKAGLSV